MSTISTSITGDHAPPPAPLEDPFRYGWRYVKEKLSDGRVEIRQVPLTKEDVLHPQEEDFIVNNEWHHAILEYLWQALKSRSPDRMKMLVLMDVRVDWEVPQGWAHGPDIGVFFDLQKPHPRGKGTLYVKRTGARVGMVIEATSPDTEDNDFEKKMYEYFVIGIPLYVIIEMPKGEVGPLRLHAYKRGATRYEPLTPDEKGRIWLDTVQLWIGIDGHDVYLEDAAGKRLPGYADLDVEKQAAEAKAERAQAEAQRAQAEAESANARAAAEAAERAALERRLKQAEDELKRLRQSPR